MEPGHTLSLTLIYSQFYPICKSLYGPMVWMGWDPHSPRWVSVLSLLLAFMAENLNRILIVPCTIRSRAP